MGLLTIILRPVITFAMVASFALFFMSFFVVAGILTTKIQRNVVERIDEVRNLGGYATAGFGGLVAGCISLVAMIYF